MKIKSLIFILFCWGSAYAQENLSLQNAVELGISNNYQLKIARNQQEIARINSIPGNAGFFPVLSANGIMGGSNTNIRQNFSNGLTVNQNGVGSNNINGSLLLSWTVFDGLKMFAVNKKYDYLEESQVYSTRYQLENLVMQIQQSYFEILGLQSYLESLLDLIKISEERVSLANARLNIGTGNKVELLQAKVDLNAQKNVYLSQKQILDQKKIELNILLSRDPDFKFTASDSISFNEELNPEEIKAGVLTKNSNILAAEFNLKAAEKELKEYQSYLFPTITLNGGYNINRQENQAGFSLLNQSNGFTGNVTATMNLFNGGKYYNSLRIARINNLISKTSVDELKNNTLGEFYRSLAEFQTNKNLLDLEEQNVVIAKENLDIALERYKTGTSDYLELRQAQTSYGEALARLVLARIRTKNSALSLKRIGGLIIE